MSWTLSNNHNWDTAAVVLSAAPAPPQADVVTTVTGPASVFAATNFSYAILVTNQGPSTASNIMVSDSLPAGVTFVLSIFGRRHEITVAWSPGRFWPA